MRRSEAWRYLQWRLWLAAALATSIALALAGVWLALRFERHVTQQFDQRLQDQLTQVLARLTPGADGVPRLTQRLLDPRWEKPYGGLYWQLEPQTGTSDERLLRSRSLWDQTLKVPRDFPADGTLHRHDIAGWPGQERLRALEQWVQWPGQALRWRLVVAADTAERDEAIGSFRADLVGALLILATLLLLATAAQVRLGLRPLRALVRDLTALRQGKVARLHGPYPAEVQPVVDALHELLERDRKRVEQARRLAGNLAHAIKTPLAVLASFADDWQSRDSRMAESIREQVAAIRAQLDWHLRRARVASAAGLRGRTDVAQVLHGLLRVMRKVHARAAQSPGLQLTLSAPPQAVFFAGESEDLQEMVGNLLDNACQWAHQRVQVSAALDGVRLTIAVEDDGPGLDAAQREAVLQRGVRLDERVPGTGLGLDIVREVAELYGGSLRLEAAALGGLRAVLDLPAA